MNCAGTAGRVPIGAQHGRMRFMRPKLRGDDVIALVAMGEEHTLEGEVVGLAAAARENNFIVVAAEQCCDLAASNLKGNLCLNGSPMPTRWIAVMVLKKRTH